jgi:hypothetical protein
MPERKIPISLRLDPDLYRWFKSRGRGYQTLINAVLRAYMYSQLREAKSTAASHPHHREHLQNGKANRRGKHHAHHANL